MDLNTARAAINAGTLAGSLTWVATLIYLVAFAPLVWRLRQPRSRPPALIDHLPVALGFLVHLVAVVLRGIDLKRLPLGNLQEACAFLALLLAASYLVAAARGRFAILQIAILGLVTVFMFVSSIVPRDLVRLQARDLRGRWFAFHTLSSLLGFTALVLTCVLSLIYLWEERELKHKRLRNYLRFLPSLESCDNIGYRLLTLGFPLFTVGIVTGMFWSSRAPGWSWGFKETMAVVAWAVYAFLVHNRVIGGVRGRRAALLAVTGSIIALAAVLAIPT